MNDRLGHSSIGKIRVASAIGVGVGNSQDIAVIGAGPERPGGADYQEDDHPGGQPPLAGPRRVANAVAVVLGDDDVEVEVEVMTLPQT
jgi:hypothetical protein